MASADAEGCGRMRKARGRGGGGMAIEEGARRGPGAAMPRAGRLP